MYPSSGICSVVGQLTYEPGVPFTVVDSTHITINTYGDHYMNDLIVYGGATGLALSMDADIIPAGSAYGNNVAMRTHTTRIIGTTATGDLILWNTGKNGQNSFNTKALLTTFYPNLTVTPTISGGTITSATITEVGNEYIPVNRVIADSGSTFYADTANYAPVPAVSVSAGCDAVLSVAYYRTSGGGVFLGTPSTTAGAGGTNNIQITNGGTTCTGATITIQNTFPANAYHIYDFGIVPTFNFTALGDGSKMMNTSTLYLALQNPSNWPSGSSVVGEVWPHIRAQYSAGMTVQNYHDGGSDITWMPYNFDGLRGSDTMVSFLMGDAVLANGAAGPRASEFTQRGLAPIPGVQSFRSPAAAGMRIRGNFTDTMDLSAPNGGSLFAVGSWGYKSAANLRLYNLFNLQTADGNFRGITFDPVSNAVSFTSSALTNSMGLSVFPTFITASAGQTITLTSFVTNIDCNGVSFNITSPVGAGAQINVTNISTTTACTVNAANIGNSFQTSSWSVPVTTSLNLYSTFGRLHYVNPAVLTAQAVAVAGNLSNSTTGNASTATALAARPAQCGSGQYATGVEANGNANCGTPASVTLQTNGTNNGSQSTLNIAAGTNISASNSGGTTTLAVTGVCLPSGVNCPAAPAGVTLQTNGSNNGSQATLNLKAGSNVTLSNSGGDVTISATGSGSGVVNTTTTITVGASGGTYSGSVVIAGGAATTVCIANTAQIPWIGGSSGAATYSALGTVIYSGTTATCSFSMVVPSLSPNSYTPGTYTVYVKGIL